MGYETWTEERAAHFERMAAAQMPSKEIAAELRVSERAVRRYLARWKIGIPAVNPPHIRKHRPPPGRSFVASVEALPPELLNAYRARVIDRAQRGWEASRISDACKMPVGIVREWLAEWGGPQKTVEESTLSEPPAAPSREYHPWPRVSFCHDDWPADARFEDCPRAVRDVTGGRPRFTDGLRSYSGNAAAMCAY